SEPWVVGIRLIVIDSGDDNLMPVWKRFRNAIQFACVSAYYNWKTTSDIVIASSGPITIGIPGLIGKWTKRVPLVFEVRDLWPDGGIEMGFIRGAFKIKISRWFEKLIYKNSAMLITASPGQKDHIQQRFPNQSIAVIPHATDLDLFSNPETIENPFDVKFKYVFLHIGSLGFIHNTRYIVESAKILHERGRNDIGIVFIGEGSERAAMELLVEAYGLQDMVQFWGIKPKQDVAKCLTFATATLFTTLDNPVQNTCSPNKLYDSFAAGIPVIQTTTGWIKTMFEETKCGMNVSPNRYDTMANAIIYLCDHPDVVRQMSEHARQLANTEFNADVLAHRYLSYLQSLTL
ncbi:MAG: glycosyltransferase family 4 protein, partial [Chitinophagaceae bacterium]|nr:glycosyltransferase family 4 protein [Chitinophagaceae bacterium]